MRVSPKLLAFEIMAFLVFAVLAGAGFLAWRLSRGPIDLEMIRPRIERSLAEARGGQPVKIKSLALEWSRDRARVEAAAHGVTALDGKGQVVSQAERATITFNASALMGGHLKTERIRLENGRASVTRSKDGVWSIANVVFLREPSKDKPFNLKDLNWQTLATPIRALISAGSFERVELVNFSLDVRDEGANSTWSANPVNGVWNAGADGVTFDLDMKLTGAGSLPNSLHLALVADGKVSRAKGQAAFTGVDPVTVARMFGYGGDALTSGAPGNASFAIEATEANGLQGAQLSIADAKGALKVDGVNVSIQDLDFDATFDPATRQVDVKAMHIVSDRLTGDFSGSANVTDMMAGNMTKPIAFHLLGNNFIVSAVPIFALPWSFKSLELQAAVAPDFSDLAVANIQFATGGLTGAGSGDVMFGPPDARKFGIKMKATGAGEIVPQQVVDFWPVDIAGGARTWVKEHVKAGKATKATLNVDIKPGALDRGYVTDDELQVEFYATDASISFLDDFPPITGVQGIGHVRGNSMTVEATTGKMSGWALDEAKVDMPRFYPHGAIMLVAASGRGDLRNMMQVLQASNLKVGDKYGLKVDQMGGSGSANVVFKRPMVDEVPDSDLQFDIKGGFLDASAPDLAYGFGLVGSDVRYEVTQAGMSISGAGKYGPAPVVFDWKETFPKLGTNDNSMSELTATAKVTPDLLNAFGVAARNIMQGEADMELRASGSGRDFTSITANLDLTRASLEISELGWRKKFDAAATGTMRYGKDLKTGNAVMTGDIRADGLELTGEARLDAKSQMQSASIEHIFSRGSVDLHGDLSRKADGGYRLALAGPLFDASPWMDSFLTMSDAQKTAADTPPSGPPDPPFQLQLNADKLKVRDDAELTKADILLDLVADGPQSGHVRGIISPGKKLDVAISPSGDSRHIVIKSDDAGFGAKVLLKTDYLVGGGLVIDGLFKGSHGDAKVTMTDVRLRNAPLLAQLLSVASLRGLADVLNGDGVLFTKVESPIVLGEGRIDLPGLRASGPAMGLTARGWVAPNKSELSLDGVLVPSFGVNSALGGLPIIGDLFVSRQGEGLFAPTYSVRGTFERARVSVNPIAALTPGVLRRIFENPTEAPPSDQAAPPPQAPVAQAPPARAAPAAPPLPPAPSRSAPAPDLSAKGPAPLSESRN
ncbi:MAG: DUF3971 domain-containing protein [Alphaproteobacteria bacterium]